MIDQIQKVSDSPAVAVLGAGAALANPGGFIPIALKNISELDPSAAGYIAAWLFFTLVSLLPLALALVLLLVARDWTGRLLERRAGMARAAREDDRRGDPDRARRGAAAQRDLGLTS